MILERQGIRRQTIRWAGTFGAVVVCTLSLVTGLLSAPHAFAAGPGDSRLVRIDTGGSSSASKRIVLPLGKSAIVNLPEAASDVIVSNPETVQAVVRASNRIFLIGLQVGDANAFFFNARGDQILNLEIRVERDLTDLRAALQKFLPDARIEVEPINDNIVLAGFVPNAAQSSNAVNIAARIVGDPARVMNMMTIEAKDQVNLKVVVAEMQRNMLKQLGVNWRHINDFANFDLFLQTTNSFAIAGRALGGLATAIDGEGITSYTGGGQRTDALIDALERNGLLKTLAEPTLTAISGESARFLAGGEFPTPSSQDQNGNVIVEFKPFGVGVAFTPIVLDEARISMKVSTEVSELSEEGALTTPGDFIRDEEGNLIQLDGLTIPALKVRRAETAVELPSGGSMVLAGLLSEATRRSIDGVPGLKDTPVLGQLFRSNDFLNEETELVIIATPYLVDAVNRKDLVLPTDGFAPAGDLDTILLGKLNATYGVNGPQAVKGALQGPVGFIVE